MCMRAHQADDNTCKCESETVGMGHSWHEVQTCPLQNKNWLVKVVSWSSAREQCGSSSKVSRARSGAISWGQVSSARWLPLLAAVSWLIRGDTPYRSRLCSDARYYKPSWLGIKSRPHECLV
jgi:hypothetical protein